MIPNDIHFNTLTNVRDKKKLSTIMVTLLAIVVGAIGIEVVRTEDQR